MATTESLLATIKSGQTTSSSVAELQTWLGGSGTDAEPCTTRTKQPAPSKASRIEKPGRKAKAASSKVKAEIAVQDDGQLSLSAKQRLSLALAVVNSSLIALSQAVARARQLRQSAAVGKTSITRTPSPRRSTPRGPQVLRECSNNVVSVCSPTREARDQKASPAKSGDSSGQSTAQLVALAKCSRLAIEFLRQLDPTKLETRASPLTQETAALSLVEKLLILDLNDLAIEELQLVKRRLERMFRVSQSPAPTPIAQMLDFDIDTEDPQLLSLVISYKLHTLNFLSRQPQTMLEALEYLTDSGKSVERQILQHARRSQDDRGAGRALDKLARLAKDLKRSVVSIASQPKALHNNIDLAVRFVTTALKHTTSTEITDWVTRDSVEVLLSTDTLPLIAKKLAVGSFSDAWTSSPGAIALGMLLKALVCKLARPGSGKPGIILLDDKGSADDERGALVEFQLRSALELVLKHGERDTLQTLIDAAMRRVAMIYSNTDYPLRRARLLAFLLRARERYSGLFPPNALEDYFEKQWTEPGNLGQDKGLSLYLPELKISILTSRALSISPPSMNCIGDALLELQESLRIRTSDGPTTHSLDDGLALIAQLLSLDDLFTATGEDETRLSIAQTLGYLVDLVPLALSERISLQIRQAKAFLGCRYAERAGHVLDQIEHGNSESPDLTMMLYHLTCADRCSAMDDQEGCRKALRQASRVRRDLISCGYSGSESRELHLLCGQEWLLQSWSSMMQGNRINAIRLAKMAVTKINGLWSMLQRNGDPCVAREHRQPIQSDDSDKETGCTGMRKLQLKPENIQTTRDIAKPPAKGAAFWPIIPVLLRAMMHLSDLYAHSGIFGEAKYYSEQAIRIVDSISLNSRSVEPYQHHVMLLIAAGSIEDAELCLERCPKRDATKPTLATIRALRAEAYLRSKEGSLDRALELLKLAEDFTTKLSYATTTTRPYHDERPLKSTRVAVARTDARTSRVKGNATTKTRQQPVAKKVARPLVNISKGIEPCKDADIPTSRQSCYMLGKLHVELLLDQAIMSLELGRDTSTLLKTLDLFEFPVRSLSKMRQVEHRSKMQQAELALLTNFSFSMLPESTLCYPALMSREPIPRCVDIRSPQAAVLPKSKAGKKPPPKAARQDPQRSQSDNAPDLLFHARSTLQPNVAAGPPKSTVDAHIEQSQTTNVSMFLEATYLSEKDRSTSQSSQYCSIDTESGRIYASQCREDVAQAHRDYQQHPSDLSLSMEALTLQQEGAPGTFQEQYIDILPQPWRAVSLYLSESLDELFVARYERGRTPLFLRLPFARHKEDEDDDIFDFETGKAELLEIIELSNYSCHSNQSTSVKSKTWWNERETLDKRLHNLLLNIQDVWLGGFRGILSQSKVVAAQLARFRKGFEAILDRHLPSRQAPRRESKRLLLNDHVLELFIGLGNHHDGAIDLDEALSDLLYFVVDILQFNGEPNAYDEIDFDAMTTEVLDALQEYHETAANGVQSESHLVLILDRRLQAIPWESLPCLEGASVSRLDSMHTLRERLLAMRRGVQNGQDECSDARFTVPRNSGSYILNPGGDLTSTEATLGSVLSQLKHDGTSNWSSIVHREPSKDEFRTALSVSTFLYFGHGSGSQYLGPKAIRTLEECSQVVWLMGCSSGAITEHGAYEASVVPYDYLTAGHRHGCPPAGGQAHKCMAIVANLWDVTDKDIDRFSLAVGEEWGLWEAPAGSSKLPGKVVKQRTAMLSISTPQRPANALKTPKTHKTGARAHSPPRDRSDGRPKNHPDCSLTEAVAKSRDACYLRYLNGAAPVVFGVPVYLGG